MNKNELLQAKNEKLAAQVAFLEEGLASILRYVESPKFWEDSKVETMDIIARIREIRSGSCDIEFEPYGWACPIKKGPFGMVAIHSQMTYRDYVYS